ncbi:acetyl-CoA hydrolase [Mesorhizobium sp. L-8-10]|nr:acetyl-CoA hydrolase [Mesorhizobium sp. L-8-10]
MGGLAGLLDARCEIDVADIDFTQLVRPGDTVMWSQGIAEPTSLIRRLMAQRYEIGPFNVFLGGSYSATVLPVHTDFVTVYGMGAVGSNRALCRAEKMNVIPCHLSQLPALLDSGAIRVDVVLMQVSRPDHDGLHSYGAANSYAQHALARARMRIAAINDWAPRTASTRRPDLSDYDIVVRDQEPLVELPSSTPDETDSAVAANIARFIADGAILQVGIGTVPNALLAALGDRRRLGLHSGVVGDAIVPLIESGVLDNSTKTLDRGRTVTNALAGTRRLSDFADGNPDLLVEPVDRTHDHSVLAGLKGFVSVNSAVEVDLTGQVGSEVAGRHYLGTIGGQLDFVRGALAAEGGRSIMGLPARTAKGTSRIVARIESAVVTVPRSDADIIATEFGIAELRGKSIEQRVKAMISIAHPDERDALMDAARKHVAGIAR